ncbi:hypothetical protein V6N13_072372 [Hibiscus sabdariffa]|uniref:Uncharacterized protein n=1 Tax=Hibiscus sabdariffa TaxID=183260 RepID=A0ABR2R869_9ROSI
MNVQSRKELDATNAQSEVEKAANCSSVEKSQETESMQITHQYPQPNQKTSGGVLTGAAAAAASALESAKDAIARN